MVGQSCSKRFVQKNGKLPKLNCVGIPKKLLKGEYQLRFELVNKVLLPRTEKRTVAFAGDLFLMEALCKFDSINLPSIMLENMPKTLIEQKEKHGMGYGYFLTRVFKYMEIPLEAGVRETIKQSFSMNTLVECECMEGNIGYMSKMTELVVEQSKLRHELKEMTALLSHKDA